MTLDAQTLFASHVPQFKNNQHNTSSSYGAPITQLCPRLKN